MVVLLLLSVVAIGIATYSVSRIQNHGNCTAVGGVMELHGDEWKCIKAKEPVLEGGVG